MEEKKKPTNGAQGRLPHKGNAIISQLAHEALTAGYRVTPIYKGGALGPYLMGQDYSDLNDKAWAGAVAVGIILDRAVLIDYDGNKADEMGDYIPPVADLPKVLKVNIMPEPAQVSEDGRSVHYLFKLPNDGAEYSHSADGKLVRYVDIKCQNQVMHLKPGKTLKLPHRDALTVAPASILFFLNKEHVGARMSFQELEANLYTGSNWHDSANRIVGKLAAEGKTVDEVETWFEQRRAALASVRPDDIDRLFNECVPRGIQGAIDKGYFKPELPMPFEEEPEEEAWWDEWVYVGNEHKLYNRVTMAVLKPEAFNAMMSRQNTYVGKVRYTPFKYALEVGNADKVQFAMYAPAFGETFDYLGNDCFNTYKRQYVPATAPSYTSVFEDHIKMLFPFDWLPIVQWMAWVVRHPGRKVHWAPLLKGIEGDGKTAIGNMVIAAMGQDNANIIDMAALRSEFNGWALGSCFGLIEEVRVTGQNRHMVMDKLKPLIASDEISVTRKGENSFKALNTMNYMLLTNHSDALAIGEDARRYGIYFTQFKDRSELPDEHYYSKLWDEIRAKPGEIRAWLEAVDLSGFNPHKAPATTDAKYQMMLESRPEHVLVLEEALTWEMPGIHPDTFSTSALNNLIREMHLGPELKTSLLTKAAEALGYEKWPKNIKWKGMTHRAYVKKGYSLDASKIRECWDSANVFESEE